MKSIVLKLRDKGLLSLLSFGHAAHMDDVWLKTKPLYEAIKKDANFNDSLCNCITMEKETGIIRELLNVAYQLRNWDSLRFVGPGIRPDLFSSKYRKIPRLTNSATWDSWKNGLIRNIPPEKELFNFASYMYCKLKKYLK